jgi:hypothetical protein
LSSLLDIRYSEENLIYRGDPPKSEAQTMPNLYSNGHLDFVRRLSAALNPDTPDKADTLPADIEDARRRIVEEQLDSPELLFYETNPKKIRAVFRRLKGEPADSAVYSFLAGRIGCVKRRYPIVQPDRTTQSYDRRV